MEGAQSWRWTPRAYRIAYAVTVIADHAAATLATLAIVALMILPAGLVP